MSPCLRAAKLFLIDLPVCCSPESLTHTYNLVVEQANQSFRGPQHLKLVWGDAFWPSFELPLCGDHLGSAPESGNIGGKQLGRGLPKVAF